MVSSNLGIFLENLEILDETFEKQMFLWCPGYTKSLMSPLNSGVERFTMS